MARALTRLKVTACRASAVFALVCVTVFLSLRPTSAQDLSQVLYRFENRALTLGRYGAVAVFQERLLVRRRTVRANRPAAMARRTALSVQRHDRRSLICRLA